MIAPRGAYCSRNNTREAREDTWKINREIIVIAGWGRAVLLQLAHPAIAAGVHDHSSFRGSVLSGFQRLHSTVGAMLSLTSGGQVGRQAARP